jgi:hypothetical protein
VKHKKAKNTKNDRFNLSQRVVSALSSISFSKIYKQKKNVRSLKAIWMDETNRRKAKRRYLYERKRKMRKMKKNMRNSNLSHMSAS